MNWLITVPPQKQDGFGWEIQRLWLPSSVQYTIWLSNGFIQLLKSRPPKNLEKLLRLSFLSRRYLWAQLQDSTQLSNKCEMIQQWRGVPVGTSIFSRWSDKKNGASWVDGGEEVCLPLSSTGGPAGNEIRQRQPLHRERYPRVIPKLLVTMLLVALVARSAHFTLWLNSFSKCWPGCLNIGPRSQIMAFINLIWNRLHHKSQHHMVDKDQKGL